VEVGRSLRTLFPNSTMLQLLNDIVNEGNADARLLLLCADDGGNAEGKLQPYQCFFDVVRRGIPIVPLYDKTEHARPTAPEFQTATVVGPAGEEIYTDEYGRIKVQFHWQRSQDHPEGNANLDDRSSTWIRVMTSSADVGWGAQHIPRVGSEVLITFIDQDIDRPICVGNLHNGLKKPPTFSDVGSLPANKALSGIKTKEYKGAQFNEMVFDDTRDQLRTKLSSEHAKTQFNQGYLIHPRSEGKGVPRGEGFELRTDAAAALRAAHSLILSTESQLHARGNQLDRQTLQSLLDSALKVSEQLSEAAVHQHAHQTETGRDNQLIDDDAQPGKISDHGHQTHLKEALHNLERGTNTDPEGKSGKGKQRGQQAIIAMSAPDGIAITTQGSMTLATGTNLDQVALRDTNQTTGRRWIHNVTESASLFVSGAKATIKDTIKLITAKGNVQVHAQDGEIALTAQKDVTITSVNGKIVIQAPKEVLIMAGGGYVRIGKDIEIHNPGSQKFGAKDYLLGKKAGMKPVLPQMPKSVCKECKRNAAKIGTPLSKLD